MGYHVYDLAEFDLSAIGRHRTYLYLFSQNPAARMKFAEEIGATAVSITNGVNDIDWLLLKGLPEWLNHHAFFYATVVILCPAKADARRFLAYLKRVFAWQESAQSLTEIDATGLAGLSELDGIGVVVMPRDPPEMHDRGLLTLARLVRDGVARSFIRRGEPDRLGDRLAALTGLRCYHHRSLVVVDTGQVLTPAEELHKSAFEELFAALRELRDALAALPQDRRTNAILRELGRLRKELGNARESGAKVSAQASIGFEAFGNGLKVLIDSGQLSEGLWRRARSLFDRIASIRRKPPAG